LSYDKTDSCFNKDEQSCQDTAIFHQNPSFLSIFCHQKYLDVFTVGKSTSVQKLQLTFFILSWLIYL